MKNYWKKGHLNVRSRQCLACRNMISQVNEKRCRVPVNVKGLSFSVCPEDTCFGVLASRGTDGRCSLSRGREESQSMRKRMKYAGGSSTTEPGEGQEAARAKKKRRADFKRKASSVSSSNGRMTKKTL